MDPTSEQLEGFRTLADIAAWTEIPGTVGQGNSALGSLFQKLGTTGTHHPRVVGAISKEDYDALLNAWTYTHEGEDEARAPSPVVRAQAGLIGRVARILCGLEKTLQQAADETKAKLRQEQMLAQSQAQQGTGSPQRKIKMATIINQTNDDETGLILQVDIDQCYANYRRVMGSDPPEGKECTVEQLTGLKKLVDDKVVL